MIRQAIGGHIARYRREQGLTQQALADRLGVSDKAVSKWERDLSYPDAGLLPQLARELGISVDELLSGASTPAWQSPQPAQEIASAAAPQSAAIGHGIVSGVVGAGKFGVGAIKKAVFIISSVGGVLAVAATFIVNIIVVQTTAHQQVWWPYVAGGVGTVWVPYALMMLPKLRKKLWLAGFAFSVLSTAYTFLIQRLTDTFGWVQSIYIPLLLTVIAAVLLLVWLRRRVSLWTLSGVSLMIVGGLHILVGRLTLHWVHRYYPQQAQQILNDYAGALSEHTHIAVQDLVGGGIVVIGLCLVLVGVLRRTLK